MKDWKYYSRIKKFIIGIFVIFLALLSPELMLFIDVGGIEMAFSFLLVYYKTFFDWAQKRINWFVEFFTVIKYIIYNSSIMNPKVFISHSIYSLFVMWFTGAILFSFGCVLPALFVTRIIA